MCALCRREIPLDYINDPKVLDTEREIADRLASSSTGDKHNWFYEGRNGWWEYDMRTSAELELAFSQKLPKAEMLIAGFLYVIDLENMVQYRKHERSRLRRIKRDLACAPKKGVAGLRLPSQNMSNVPLATQAAGDTHVLSSDHRTSSQSAPDLTQLEVENDSETQASQYAYQPVMLGSPCPDMQQLATRHQEAGRSHATLGESSSSTSRIASHLDDELIRHHNVRSVTIMSHVRRPSPRSRSVDERQEHSSAAQGESAAIERTSGDDRTTGSGAAASHDSQTSTVLHDEIELARHEIEQLSLNVERSSTPPVHRI